MSLLEIELERDDNPVDIIEFVAASRDWSFERAGEDELAMCISGQWTNYHVSFSWMEDFETLHLACAFDLKIPDNRSVEIIKLLSLINGQVLIGHFDLWPHEDAIIFRHSLLLSGGAEPTSQQVEAMLSGALETCEAYFQSFQFVLWSSATAREALDGVLFETVGEA